MDEHKFLSRAAMDRLCRQHGCLFPPSHFIKDWAIAVLDMPDYMQPWELNIIKTYILAQWDDGAFRTLYAYFYGSNRLAADALTEYYLHFYVDGNWICWNPSAAAVWTCRVVYMSLNATHLASYH